MKLSINLNTASVINFAKHKFFIILWVFLGVIAVLTGLVVYNEVQKISQSQADTAGIMDKIVRLNLTQHQTLEKRLSENSSFQPIPVPGANAFGMPPIPEDN